MLTKGPGGFELKICGYKPDTWTTELGGHLTKFIDGNKLTKQFSRHIVM